MSGKKISQLPVQLSLNTTGVTAVVQNDTTYKVDLQTLKDFFYVSGITIYSEDSTLLGDRIVNLSGYTLTFSGETGTTLTIVPDLIIEGNSTITGSLTINQDLLVKGNSTITGSLTINQDLLVKGNSTVTGSLKVNQNLIIEGNSTITGSLTINQDLLVKGNSTITGSLYGTSSLSYDIINRPFLYKKTDTNLLNVLRTNETTFNPSNLTVVDGSIFIVEEGSEYYVLGDLINSGSILVDGTLKIGGGLFNQGTITGIGNIE